MCLMTTLVTAGGERIECRQDSRPDQEAAALVRTAGVEPETAPGPNPRAA